MSESNPPEPDDLTGTADERTKQLAERVAAAPLSAAWLHRQLVSALAAWAEDETVLDIEQESRVDF
jgi:hypothetical protein